jgi:hypothetical protein
MWYRLAPCVSEYFNSQSNWQEQLKLKSGMYVYNGFPAHIVRSLLRKETNLKGYVPLYGEYKGGLADEENFNIDEQELEYLNKIVSFCKKNNCQLFFSQAPNYIPNKVYKEWLNNYCKKNNILLLSHVDDQFFLSKPELFRDQGHLNTNGADVYSELLAKEIMKICNCNSINE